MVSVAKQIYLLRIFALRSEKIKSKRRVKLNYSYTPNTQQLTVTTSFGKIILNPENEKDYYRKVSAINGYLNFLDVMEEVKNG